MSTGLKFLLPAFCLLLLAAPARANVSPIITASPPTTIREGQVYSYTFNATDPDGDPLQWSLYTGTETLTFNPANHTLYGRPPAGQYAINLTVTDGRGGEATFDYVLTVEEIPPTLTQVLGEAPSVGLLTLLIGLVLLIAQPWTWVRFPLRTRGGGVPRGVPSLEATGEPRGVFPGAAHVEAPVSIAKAPEGGDLILDLMVLDHRALLVEEFGSDQEEVTLSYREVLKILEGKGFTKISRLEAHPYILHVLHDEGFHFVFFTRSRDEGRVLGEARRLMKDVLKDLESSPTSGTAG